MDEGDWVKVSVVGVEVGVVRDENVQTHFQLSQERGL